MITNGVISIEDGTKAPEEFAPGRKVRVEFTFAVPEGEDATAVANAAAAAADAKVNELLGRTVIAGTVAVAVTPTGASAAPAGGKRTRAAAKPKPDATTPPAGGDKAALEAAAGLKAGGPIDTTVAAEPEQGDIDDLLGDQAPVPITDAELAKAAQNKNAQMKVKDPNFSVKIRALVVEYAGVPPKKITDIPVAKRQEFLDKLRDLK